MTITPEQFAQLTLEKAREGVKKNEFTPGDLLEASLARMNAFEPVINAVITRTDDEARKAAAEPRDENLPLAGMPIAIKDNIQTRGTRTTCGSMILENYIPPYDAAAVEKIKAAGAFINGKTNMDEFAMGGTGETSAYGPTRNPWNPALIPGGSSSGSAAIVAYGGALAALASDTGGSIRQPASFCGVVGMKPTYGKVSRNGLGALASSLDQIGPLTRTVRDNALLLDLIAGYDPHDSTSSRHADEGAPCLAEIESGVKGLRIGFDPALRELEGVSPVVVEALDQTIALLRENGAEISEVTLPFMKYGVAAYYILNCCEASANMTRFDGVRYGKRQGEGSLWEVYGETRGKGFGDEVKRRIMMGAYALSKGYYDAYYLKAARVRRLFALEGEKLFSGLDALLMPVSPRLPGRIGDKPAILDSYLGDIFTLPANMTGLPSVSFPVCCSDGLPVGVQAMGGAFRENVLYRVARLVETSRELANAPWTKSEPEVAK